MSRGAATVSWCCWDIEQVGKMNRWFEVRKKKSETQTTPQTTQPCCPSILACYPDPPALGKCYALHSHNEYFSAREQLHRRGDGAVVRQPGEREKTKKKGGWFGKGQGTTPQACSPVLSYAFRQRLTIRCGSYWLESIICLELCQQEAQTGQGSEHRGGAAARGGCNGLDLARKLG